jgi:CRP-like cAMP-binding protein
MRTATACCEEDCELLTISRDIYERTLDRSLRRDRERRIDFLRGYRIFKHMTNKQLERVIPKVVQKTINRGKIIFKEGDAADGIYLIVSGSFEITSKKNYTKPVEEEAERLRIDPIASFKLK